MSMRVYLDGQLIDPQGSTLEHAIDTARDRAGGRLLVEILADGSPIPAQDLDNPPANSPYANELRFTSDDARTLHAEALDAVVATLADVRRTQTVAAEALQEGRVDVAIAKVAEVLELWKGVKDAISMILRVSAADARSGGALPDAIEGLARGLHDLRRALAAQDWAALADCLGWDMQEHAARVESWARTV